MTFICEFSCLSYFPIIFMYLSIIFLTERRLRQRIDYISGRKVLISNFPYTSDQKYVLLTSFVNVVLSLKNHSSIQNMIWDHPQGGKLHEESFVNILRGLKMLFIQVVNDFDEFTHFERICSKLGNIKKFPKSIP